MKQLFDKIKGMKKDQILILFLAGILLLVISIPAETQPDTSFPAAEAETEKPTKLYVSKTQELEQKLETILSSVSGVGKARVMITLKSDGKKIVEKDREESSQTQESYENSGMSSECKSSENTVLQRDNNGVETPYVSEALEPEIDGVLVIAQGADSQQTISEITQAVMALFGVEAHKIKVMKMEP